MKTIRIGAGAGYSGDRIEPAVEPVYTAVEYEERVAPERDHPSPDPLLPAGLVPAMLLGTDFAGKAPRRRRIPGAAYFQ